MKQLFSQLLLACLFAAVLPTAAWAEPKNTTPPVSAAVFWPADRVRPGEALPLAVVVEISEGFHINADARQIRSSDSFSPYPTKLAVADAHEGLHSEAPLYPPAELFKADYAAGGLMSFSGRTIIYVPVKFAAELASGAKTGLRLELDYQACTESQCLLPQKIELETALPVAAAGEAAAPTHQALFADYQTRRQGAAAGGGVNFAFLGWKFNINGASWAGMLLLLATAAFGGMLLNCTPCVLPLIPIKIISLSYAAKNRRQCFLLGAAMSLGVLAFWLALGGMIALVSGFSATNQLFQYPAFTVGVGLIIGIMALGMFDFFSLPLPEWLYLIHPEQDSLHGSFGLGILAAVLSTPCTAPFMGAAAAWAATQPPAATLSVFAAIGSGMAFPYLALSAAPHLVRKMPRTGPASLLIKQVMGLLMLAAAVYFIGAGAATLLATAEQPPSKLYWLPVMGCSLAAGGWLAWRTWRIASSRALKAVFMGLGGLMMAVSIYGAVHLTERGPTDWRHYSPAALAQAQADGKAALLVFTAEWCLNCKVLEQTVLDSPQIVKLLGQENFVPMKVDITGSNPPGRELLRKVGSLSIPLLVIYSRSGELIYKSDFYTAEELREAVSRAVN
ncbi:thioredoxin family protein [Candidatus Electronema sp. JC]|uniref:protein-disulfide reductase DsbD family protein n=1 Tax=Candidatus Electronema sp. JC TaxID=3401570 RepID=UPI003B43B43B